MLKEYILAEVKKHEGSSEILFEVRQYQGAC